MQVSRIRRCLAAFAMICILAGASVAPVTAQTVGPTVTGPSTIRVQVPLAEGWWDEFYGSVETALSRRESMVQFGAVGVLIGLFIIWYRRP
jgi:hypothetical protein